MANNLRLLLIVLTAEAEARLREKGWLDDLSEQMSHRNIRLYRMEHKKDKQKSVVVLPRADNRAALLLRRDQDGGNYFVCPGIYPHRIRPVTNAAVCHQLPGNVECRIVKAAQINRGDYLDHAVDCDVLGRDIAEKKILDPALGAEGAKWRAYLDMFKGVLDGRRFGVPVRGITHKGKMAAVSLSLNADDEQGKEVADKITKARGEEVRFALLEDFSEADGYKAPSKSKAPLGKLREFNMGKGAAHVELDKEYFSSLSALIKAGSFFVGALNEAGGVTPPKQGESERTEQTWGKFLNQAEDVKQGESEQTEQTHAGAGVPATVEFAELPADTPRFGFYYDKERSVLAFSCAAQKDVAPSGEDVDDGTAEERQDDLGAESAGTDLNHWRVNPESIEVHQMALFADFVGDLSQINIMNRGLREIANKPIWDVLSGERPAQLPKPYNVAWGGDCRLNPQQREAVQKALGAPELCLIWGPPGTGKTEVIMEIAKQEALRGHKTLIASQANLAVDNALARLHGAADVWPLRIIKDDYELEKEDELKVPVWDTAGEFFVRRLLARLDKSATTGNAPDDALRVEFAKRLKTPAKPPQNRPAREIPQMAALYRRRLNVVGATLVETGKNISLQKGDNKRTWENKLHNTTGIKEFDTVIVDEVSKATPPELFLPALRGGRLVLVGDHKQLPPMLKLFSGDDLSEEEWAEKVGVPLENLDIESTLFERLWERHSKLPVPQSQRPAAKLTMQYRMHKQIQGLVEQFYTDDESTLECGLSEEEMAEMAVAESGIFANHALWLDTENDAMEQRDGTSFVNNDEVRIVRKLLAALPGGRDLSVGVITFYGAQLAKLRNECEAKFSQKFPGKLIFGTVDRFQGRECDVVICSLVRKNKHGNIGFAQRSNRINVAFSRAKRLLCIVGNSGQFCFESRSADARESYRRVYEQCERAGENDIPATADKRGDNAQK